MRVSLKSLRIFFFTSAVQASGQNGARQFFIDSIQLNSETNPILVQLFNKFHESDEPLSNGIRLCESIIQIKDEDFGPCIAPRFEKLLMDAEKLQAELNSPGVNPDVRELRQSHFVSRISGEISDIIKMIYPDTTFLSELPAFKTVIEDALGLDLGDLISEFRNQTDQPATQ